MLAKRRPDLVLPEATWSTRWVVQCTPWGEGDEAVLRYLAPYVFRVAITNNRIVNLDANGVTLRHRHRASNRWRTIRVTGRDFIAVSYNTSYPKDCTRSATTGFGIQRHVNTPPRPDICCYCSAENDRRCRRSS